MLRFGGIKALRDAIMLREAAIHERPRGIDELQHAAVVVQHLFKEAPCFLRHGPEQRAVEVAVKIGVGDGGVDLAEFEPLAGEVLREASGAWRFEQALGLLAQFIGLRHIGSEEFGIGRQRSEEAGEAIREREPVEFAGCLNEEKKLR